MLKIDKLGKLLVVKYLVHEKEQTAKTGKEDYGHERLLKSLQPFGYDEREVLTIVSGIEAIID